MSDTPFRDTVKLLAKNMDYIVMSVRCDRVRSHTWWRNVVEHGPWRGAGTARVGPPPPETLPGIAKLFTTTPEQVAAMVAADWYGVKLDGGLSARVLRLAPIIDSLADDDAARVEDLALRLAPQPFLGSSGITEVKAEFEDDEVAP